MSAIERVPVKEARAEATRSGLVAAVQRKHGCLLLALPEAVAGRAVRHLLARHHIENVAIVTDPLAVLESGVPLGPHHWAVQVPVWTLSRAEMIFVDDRWMRRPTTVGVVMAEWVFPRFCVRVQAVWEDQLREALWAVTPEPVGPTGTPNSWVPAEPPTVSLGTARNREDDIETVAEGGPLPPLPAPSDSPLDPTDTPSIRNALRSLCALAGFGDIPLEVRRPTESRDGFVEGRIWLSKAGPCRIRIDVGPNADSAEVWATLLHEVAHGMRPKAGHGRAFKAALVKLSEQRFGTGAFAVARRWVDSAHATVDTWIAVSVRAVLNGAAPAQEATGDEGQLARTVARIQKLRRLARSQLGRPEGRAACAKANDLLVRWDLGAYSVRLSEGIDDQMCDRWVVVGKRSVWRRQLAYVVAEYCGVFALSRRTKGWMHFFGRYVDVVTAEWFYEIWHDHIVRAADAHIVQYKAQCDARGVRPKTRSEKTNFCDSAVLALSRKLEALAAAHDLVAEPDQTIGVRSHRAEVFAAKQHALRGVRWTSGTGKSVRVNAAGMAAGRNAPMGRGVGGGAGVKGLLGS